jgi:hypothetical protein
MVPTNAKVIFIYFFFFLPLLIYTPMRIYLCLKYESALIALVPQNVTVCPGEEFITGYRTAHIQDQVRFWLDKDL